MVDKALAYDSSALLTLILQERGWQAVETALALDERQVVPVPALTEVIVRARERGNCSSPQELSEFLETYGVVFENVGVDDAMRAARLQEISRDNPGVGYQGRELTLSLGDALILAVAERCAGKVVSKDRYWSALAEGGHLKVQVVTLAPPVRR